MHAYNPSTLGGRDRRTTSWRSAWTALCGKLKVSLGYMAILWSERREGDRNRDRKTDRQSKETGLFCD